MPPAKSIEMARSHVRYGSAPMPEGPQSSIRVTAAPLVPEVGVVALVPDAWGSLWMPRQQVLVRLARYFNVEWVQPAHHWREIGQRNPTPSVEDILGAASPAFSVFVPPAWLPDIYRPAGLSRWMKSVRLRQACARLRARGARQIVLYLWRPEYGWAEESVPHDLSCYHVDDEYSFEETESPVSGEESALLKRVDQVFIHSPALMEKKGHYNPNTAFVPNGVDCDAFRAPAPEPEDMSAIPHPRLGYLGRIKKFLDLPLLLHLARQHPDWSLVMIGNQLAHGEIEAPIRALSELPNVYFLGPKPTLEVHRYPQHFDVCLMPYRVNAYTNCIYPMKLHEYLASGRPTVGARIRSLLEFENIVPLPDTPEAWSKAIADSLSPDANREDRCRERVETAMRHDWNVLVELIATKFAERLGGSALEHFRERAVARDRTDPS